MVLLVYGGESAEVITNLIESAEVSTKSIESAWPLLLVVVILIATFFSS